MRRARRTVDLTVRLGRLELPNPIVAASGTFGHGDEVARLCDPAALGAITVKSLAPYEWPGNPAPRLHLATAGMLNAVGLEGPGVEHWVAAELPALRSRGARVVASIWGRTVADFAVAAKMLQRAQGDLVAVEVNVSCPNLEDRARMFAHAPDTTAAAVRAVADAELALPLFVKLSPNIADLTDVAGAAIDAGATGLTLINTMMGMLIDAERRRPVLGAGGGGLSGPAIKAVALRVVNDVARAYPSTPIIGTGGVSSGVDAVEMLLAGATAVGVGTATFHDPRASLRILDELTQWCAEHGINRVADLTSALETPDG
jgi:dihydroorotate dehydrogenase (NAD+) catalytic subunit